MASDLRMGVCYGHATNVCVLDMVARLCMCVCNFTPSNACVLDMVTQPCISASVGSITRRFFAFFGLLDRLAGLTWRARAALPATLRRRAVVLRGTSEEDAGAGQ